jgi:AcrR family transcriptional regulator
MNDIIKAGMAGKRTLQKEARRNAIIEAAFEEFTAQGFTATKLDDVAERACIGKGTIYLYFDSKESLFEEVVRYKLLPPPEVAEQYSASLENFEGSAADLLVNHFRHFYTVMKNPAIQPLLVMVLAETARFPALTRFFYEEMIHPSQALIRRIVDRGVANGEFRPSAAEVYPQLLFAPVMHSVLWNQRFGEYAPIDIDRFSESHIEYMLRALRV